MLRHAEAVTGRRLPSTEYGCVVIDTARKPNPL